MNNNKSIVRMVVGIIVFIAVVAGSTYAWFAWKSSETSISGTSGCFDILYDKGQDIGTAESGYPLRPACSYEEGANASVTISVDPNCSATGTASINLNTNSFILHDGVTNAFDRGQNMLAYQVVGFTTEVIDEVEQAVETPIDGCSGYINSGSTVSLCEVELSHTPTTYKVYLYLDCNTTTTTLIGSTYSGYIQSVAYLDVN